MGLNYDAAEVRALKEALRRMGEEGALRWEEEEVVVEGGRGPACPRCDASMSLRRVPPREEVAYVRDRLWLSCPACGRNAVVDRRALER